MAATKIYHVRHSDDRWVVEGEGNKRPSATEERKADAVERAREIAQNQEPSRVVVHKQDGSVQNEYSYGGDGGRPARGKMSPADAVYALTALSSDALALAAEAIQVARQLPSQAQERAQELRELSSRREDLEERVRDLRENVEQRFEQKATEGRSLAEDLLSDERVQKVLDQAKTAQSQVKAAITSIRRLGEQIGKGAEDQARTAESQVKGAATSVKKTAETAVDAAQEGRSN